MTTLDSAISQMWAAGMPDFPPGHPVVGAGKFITFGPKKKAFYKLEEFRSRITGDYVVGGVFGWWGKIPHTRIEIDWKSLKSDADREEFKRRMAVAAEEEQAKAARLAKFAAARGRAQWQAAAKRPPDGVATYLDRKGVEFEAGLRYQPDGTLLVPMLRYDVTQAQEDAPDSTLRRFVGVQKIAPDGTKRFNKGMAKARAAARLGKAPSRGEAFVVAEGVATALSVRMATQGKITAFVTFDAGNLEPVARILRGLYPDSPMIFCADDDAYVVASLNKLLRENYGITEAVTPPTVAQVCAGRDGEALVTCSYAEDAHGVTGIVGAATVGGRVRPFSRENAGLVKAFAAADAVGNASVIWPRFAHRVLPPVLGEADPKLTDFNDLHATEGLPAVAAQLDEELGKAAFQQQVAAALKVQLAAAKKADKATAKASRVPPAFDWPAFYQRFTLIYPTDTVYDAKLEVIAKLSAVKIAFGEWVVKHWLESADRRTVNADQVVFDPRGHYPKGETVNLFRGLPVLATPAGARCDRLLALLTYLCGEAGQDQAPVTDWLLNWLAYPLQHVGTKMATAVVMHGPEGAGKNLFANAVREIYGRYAALITQTQLESPYNGWMSQRLFVIANEVISRSEMRHHVGRLKNLVTESPLPIEEKYLPLRYEDNHMNMVFFTNEFQALQISPGDRRYMIVRTPQANTPEFYSAVVEEIAAGGAAALRDFLLARDLGEFSEHTKPLVTEAKLDLIEMGMSSVQCFWQELHDGLLYPLEYAPALWPDLYAVYQTWCMRNGVKNPRQSNHFGQEFMSMNGVRRALVRVADPDKASEKQVVASSLPQRVVYKMGVKPDAVEDRVWVHEGVRRFRAAGREYRRDLGIARRPDGGLDD